MAKNNNKGFSLIEIIIAVAILSILLTPIVRQFGNTMETNRKAKALQEANEKAVYEVETFQSYSKEELEDQFGEPVVHENLDLVMYDTDGNEVDTIKYSTYEYQLDDVTVGARRYKYDNVVVLDDMSNKVRAYDGKKDDNTYFKVAYGLTDTMSDADLTQLRTILGDDFVLTNEGSLVAYDETTGYATGVVCTSTNADGSAVKHVENPNDVNLGNMHDLDKNSVALILGGTSSYDSQAFTALFSKAMDHLRELDYDSWEQALVNVDNESILSQNSMKNSKRLIKIYVDKIEGLTEEDTCFVVKADVYYDYNYKIIVKGNESASTYHDTVSYTVFSQKFNTKQVPEIYFEYQPYCATGGAGASVQYQEDDYILFDNHVDEAKLYLYKPFKDQQNAEASIDDYYTIDTDGDGEKDAKAEYYTYYTTAAKSKKVKIHLAAKESNTTIQLDSDGKQTSDSNRVYIFTNLEVEGYEDASSEVQFVSDDFAGLFNYVKGEKESKDTSAANEVDEYYPKYALGNYYAIEKEGVDDSPNKRILYRLSEDIRESERLYTITVKMVPEYDGLNTIRLSGAKGAN